MSTKLAFLKAQTPRLTYQSMVLDAFINHLGRSFSISELRVHIKENQPLNPDRETIRTAIYQLENLGLITRSIERRGLMKIPTNVYTYNIKTT